MPPCHTIHSTCLLEVLIALGPKLYLQLAHPPIYNFLQPHVLLGIPIPTSFILPTSFTIWSHHQTITHLYYPKPSSSLNHRHPRCGILSLLQGPTLTIIPHHRPGRVRPLLLALDSQKLAATSLLLRYTTVPNSPLAQSSATLHEQVPNSLVCAPHLASHHHCCSHSRSSCNHPQGCPTPY